MKDRINNIPQRPLDAPYPETLEEKDRPAWRQHRRAATRIEKDRPKGRSHIGLVIIMAEFVEVEFKADDLNKEVFKLARKLGRMSDDLDELVYDVLMKWREQFAQITSEVTGLTKPAAKKRILVSAGSKRRRGRKANWADFASLRTYGNALTIHAGRLPLRKNKDGSITSGRTKTFRYADAWILPAHVTGGKELKGQHRRVYHRKGDEAVSANLPQNNSMLAAYKMGGPVVATLAAREILDGVHKLMEKRINRNT